MTPGDVYQTLTTRHPSAESRRYLYKVNTAQKPTAADNSLTAPDDAQGQNVIHITISFCKLGMFAIICHR